MGNRRIQDSAKIISIRLLRRGRDSREEIARICGFSTRTLRRTVQRYHTTGSVAKAAAIGRGRPRLLHSKDALYLLKLARHAPCTFLDEYQKLLHRYRHLSVHISTVHRTFERAGLNKPISLIVLLNTPPITLLHWTRLPKDDRTYARLWGRAPVGQRAEAYQPFVRKRRFTGIAALALDVGIIASRVIEGSSDRDTFIDFLRNDLLPEMNPYPAPRSVILLDNARIHHSDEIRELVESFGCRIEYLPPYSPHYNPIEQVFSVIKSYLRRIGIEAYPTSAAYYELYRSFQIITPEMTWGFFRHSGLI
ncbi:Transposase domain-containing protein [Mycena sanguinolenta]|uniref:Transposase domain-containing protein n=1 Tax=Mycena sanguinolenta TaxID=230812 RepID=A0A8H6Y2F7_9AGAR|nr:Transposase domain-containing protein [Mycena sanguinolenta]